MSRPIAIDISDTIIRLASLERSGRGWKLPIRAEIPVPVGLIVDGDVKRPPEVSQLLRSLVYAAGTQQQNVTFALPERHTFVKLISLSGDPGLKFDDSVREAMTQHIPYNLDEVYWDAVRTNQRDSHGQLQVLIGAAPRTTVDEYLEIFNQAGLHVEDAEIESMAVTRALFGQQPTNDARIVIDLGRTRSTLILIDHGLVQFSSTLRYAGRELNRFIADELHISDEQAERSKTLFGLDPKRGKGLLRKVLAPHIDAIAKGVADVEAFFEEHFIDHRPITTIHVTGSGALLRNIDVELRERLEQEVIVQPSWIFDQLLAADRHLPVDLGFTHTTVLGLALRPWFKE